jgi:hypothetical protein
MRFTEKLNIKFDYIIRFILNSEYHKIYYNKKVGIIDNKSNLILPIQYDNIIETDINYYILINNDIVTFFDLTDNKILDLKLKFNSNYIYSYKNIKHDILGNLYTGFDEQHLKVYDKNLNLLKTFDNTIINISKLEHTNNFIIREYQYKIYILDKNFNRLSDRKYIKINDIKEHYKYKKYYASVIIENSNLYQYLDIENDIIIPDFNPDVYFKNQLRFSKINNII